MKGVYRTKSFECQVSDTRLCNQLIRGSHSPSPSRSFLYFELELWKSRPGLCGVLCAVSVDDNLLPPGCLCLAQALLPLARDAKRVLTRRFPMATEAPLLVISIPATPSASLAFSTDLKVSYGGDPLFEAPRRLGCAQIPGIKSSGFNRVCDRLD
jgi:hypothetical protein